MIVVAKVQKFIENQTDCYERKQHFYKLFFSEYKKVDNNLKLFSHTDITTSQNWYAIGLQSFTRVISG